jgi:hypothetical protein
VESLGAGELSRIADRNEVRAADIERAVA